MVADYKPGGAEAEEQLWDEGWDGEGDDGDFKAILKEELEKAKKKWCLTVLLSKRPHVFNFAKPRDVSWLS